MNALRDPDRDAGYTLAEVVVTMLLATLFLGLAGLLLASGVSAQAHATERDQATGRSAVIGNSILTSIRGSAGFVIVGSNRALISKVVLTDGSAQCRGWLVIAAGDPEYRRSASDAPYVTGDIIYKESAGAISVSDGLGWSALVERGDAAGDGVRGAADLDGDGVADPFARDGSTLSVAIDVTLGDATIGITNGVTMQAQNSAADATTCW